MQLEELKDKLSKAKWQDEVKLVQDCYVTLRPISVRQLAIKLDKSKTWIQTSLTIARALEELPDLEEFENRYQAYQEILRLNRLKEFLK